ncbi:hypothetical protein [Citricoccus sp. GCM10030269]|uniref:hypothetical protein n=1 Tax=Citricoccus sp. GCM10030269 TaxID=3273388 RepID=UPI0036117260
MTTIPKPVVKTTVKATGLVAALMLVATGCGQNESPDSSASGSGTSASVSAQPETTETPLSPGSGEESTSNPTSGSGEGATPGEESSTESTTGSHSPTGSQTRPGSAPLPSDEINALLPSEHDDAEHTFPNTDEVHVVGVPQGSSLNIRLSPGVGREGDIIDSASPQETLTLTGREGYYVDEGGSWAEIVTEAENGGDLYGWVNLKYIATFGPVSDVTDEFSDLGSGSDPEKLVTQLADVRAPADEPEPEHRAQGTERSIVATPDAGVGEWTVDLIGGYRDTEENPEDRTHGERLAVQVEKSGGEFTVSSVESTMLCSGEVDEDGTCS